MRSCIARRSAEQGVEAALLDVGESHVELLRAARSRERGRQVPDQARRGASPRRLPGRVGRRHAGRARRTGHAADRRAAANRNPRLPGSLHPSFEHRRRADRDRRARRRPLRHARQRQATESQHRIRRGQVLSARVGPDELSKLREALGSKGWHELTAEDGTVALDLDKHRLRARRPRGVTGSASAPSAPRRSRVNSVDSTTSVTVRLTPRPRGSARAPACEALRVPACTCSSALASPATVCAEPHAGLGLDRALDRLAADVRPRSRGRRTPRRSSRTPAGRRSSCSRGSRRRARGGRRGA